MQCDLSQFAQQLQLTMQVASKAQRKVPVPEGLDLTEWINEPPAEEVEAAPVSDGVFFVETTTVSSPSYKAYESDDDGASRARSNLIVQKPKPPKRKHARSSLPATLTTWLATCEPPASACLCFFALLGAVRFLISLVRKPTSSSIANDLVEVDNIPIKRLGSTALSLFCTNCRGLRRLSLLFVTFQMWMSPSSWT